MSLNEDRIRNAIGASGIDHGSSGSGGSGGRDGARPSWFVPGCENSCQEECQRCQDPCESSCQGYQCRRCEYDTQCGTCESYQGCQTTCEKSYQCGTCQSCQNCQTTCEKSAQNTAPTIPSTINVPSSARPEASITISWGASTDTNLAGYILERRIGSGSYTQVYKGASRSYTDTVPKGANSLTYRVRAYDTGGLSSGYRTSNAITIITNVSPTISDRDRDLGGKTAGFKIPISVDDKDLGDTLTLVAKLNGELIRSIENAKRGTTYQIEITDEKINQLEINAVNEVEISATDGKATTYRRFKFKRINSAPKIDIEVSDLGKTDEPFEIAYTVTDAEKDAVDIKILYGTKTLHTAKNIEQGKRHTWKIPRLEFAQIPSGQQVIKIEAKDAHGGREVKLVNFSKTINGCGYILRRDTAEMARQIIVSANAEVAEGSEIKLYVCNNARDSKPNWEEVGDKLLYTVKNTTKTANKWAVGVKVEIKRTSKTKGDSYLYGIGVNYR